MIRLHSEKIHPPRALWVPFELGRPLGVPHDAAFQSRVLQKLIDLFDIPEGPVLVDFTEDAPGSGAIDMEGLVCPVQLDASNTEDETLEMAVVREIGEEKITVEKQALRLRKEMRRKDKKTKKGLGLLNLIRLGLMGRKL